MESFTPKNVEIFVENKASRLDGMEAFDPDKRIDMSKVDDGNKKVEKPYDPDARIEVEGQEKEETKKGMDKIDKSVECENVEKKKDEAEKGDVDQSGEEDISEKKGGSYREVHKKGEGDIHEDHHMPADSASHLDFLDGPVIKMDKDDHKLTASYGSSKEARAYCAEQKKLIEQGKFREAIQMDIDDIREKFGNRYDDAISEMMEYVDKLEEEGKING